MTSSYKLSFSQSLTAGGAAGLVSGFGKAFKY